jgi:hypothetical protein
MTATVDHLVYASPELGQAVEQIAGILGVRPAYGGQHRGLGTHNALLGLGPLTYLEIIAPDPSQPQPAEPMPFGLGQLTVPALRGWAAAPDNFDEAISRSVAAGFDYGPVMPGQRRTADGLDLQWRMSSTSLRPGLAIIPFLIDWGRGSHPADDAPTGAVLAGFRLLTPEPGRAAAQLEILGLDVDIEQADRPGLQATLSGPGGAELVLTS